MAKTVKTNFFRILEIKGLQHREFTQEKQLNLGKMPCGNDWPSSHSRLPSSRDLQPNYSNCENQNPVVPRVGMTEPGRLRSPIPPRLSFFDLCSRGPSSSDQTQ